MKWLIAFAFCLDYVSKIHVPNKQILTYCLSTWCYISVHFIHKAEPEPYAGDTLSLLPSSIQFNSFQSSWQEQIVDLQSIKTCLLLQVPLTFLRIISTIRLTVWLPYSHSTEVSKFSFVLIESGRRFKMSNHNWHSNILY